MVRFTQEAPAVRQSQYVIAAYKGAERDGREIRIVFIVGKRFAVHDLGIREAAKSVDVLLDHPVLKSYIRTMVAKFARKKSFAKPFYVIPAVNEDLATYFDIAAALPCAAAAD